MPSHQVSSGIQAGGSLSAHIFEGNEFEPELPRPVEMLGHKM